MSDDQSESGGARFRAPPGTRNSIFISYRRSDSQDVVGRLTDSLRRYFGSDRIYRDLDSNRIAEDYVVQIEDALIRSRVVLAVLGPTWLTSRSASGLGIQDVEDPVRRELERALADDVATVVVLTGDANPPAPSDLPPSLSKLARLHACRLRDEDWDYDFGRVLETLRKHGVVAAAAPGNQAPTNIKVKLTKQQRYERTVVATRRRAYDSVVGAVELLRYRAVDADPESAQVRFTTKKRRVVVKIIDAEPGKSTVVVEFDTVRAAVFAPAFTFGAAAWGVLRAWERTFAVGFLDNVVSVLEARGVSGDSSLPPGVHKWRNRSREV